MDKFKGKVLLELGTNVGSVDIVKYAKSEGAYVIVVDNLDQTVSEAKQYANESAMISTTDIDALFEFCLRKKVDGVFCGVSETNLLSVMKLCKKLNLPCYLNEKHFRLNNDKVYFKQKCQELGIDVPKIYDKPFEEDISFPVVVKPTDMSSGIGVKVCNDKKELLSAFENAKLLSKSNSALVEQYVWGEELTLVYTIVNGKAELSCVKDKYLSQDKEFMTSISDLLLCPSKYLKLVKEKYDEKLKLFIKKNLYKNGVAFFQGIYFDEKVYFFEMGTRMSGGADYKIIEENSGNNFLKLLVDISMGLNHYDLDLDKETPFFKEAIGCMNFFCRGGKISKLTSKEKILKINGVISILYLKKEKDIIIEDGTLKQNAIKVFFKFPNLKELVSGIDELNNTINILDEFGNDLRLKKFNTNRLFQN